MLEFSSLLLTNLGRALDTWREGRAWPHCPHAFSLSPRALCEHSYGALCPELLMLLILLQHDSKWIIKCFPPRPGGIYIGTRLEQAGSWRQGF